MSRLVDLITLRCVQVGIVDSHCVTINTYRQIHTVFAIPPLGLVHYPYAHALDFNFVSLVLATSSAVSCFSLLELISKSHPNFKVISKPR